MYPMKMPNGGRARWILGCLIVALLPLAGWAGGCDDVPIVQPDGGVAGASGSGSGAGEGGRGGIGGAGGTEGGGGGAGGMVACCQEATECAPDGRRIRRCQSVFQSLCAPPGQSYGYVWGSTEDCPNGCHHPDGGQAACRSDGGAGGGDGNGGSAGAAGDGGRPQCCNPTLPASCSADGRKVVVCAPVADDACATAYSHSWQVRDCPDGCSDAPDAGATCR